jgi:hypothetical protein
MDGVGPRGSIDGNPQHYGSRRRNGGPEHHHPF